MDFSIQLSDQVVDLFTCRPLVFRLEQYGGLEHGQRRRIGRGFCPSRFAVHAFDFRHGLDDTVCDLEQIGGLVQRDTGQSGRHVEQITFI